MFYKGDVCIGSARINRPGPSLYTMNEKNCRSELQKLREEISCYIKDCREKKLPRDKDISFRDKIFDIYSKTLK